MATHEWFTILKICMETGEANHYGASSSASPLGTVGTEGKEETCTIHNTVKHGMRTFVLPISADIDTDNFTSLALIEAKKRLLI